MAMVKFSWDWSWSYVFEGPSFNSIKSRIGRGAMMLGMWKANTSKSLRVLRKIRRKQRRLDKLHVVPTHPEKGIRINVTKKVRNNRKKYPNHFFAGTDGYLPPQKTQHDVVHVVEKDLHVIDRAMCRNGIFIEGKDMDEKHDFVCIMLPRKRVQDVYSEETFGCLLEVERLSRPNPRGKGASPISETGHKYTILGLVPGRFRHGIFESLTFRKVKHNAYLHKVVSDLIFSMERKVHKYLHYHIWKALKTARQYLGWECFPFQNGEKSKLFPAMACGLNVYLPAHVDNDAFLSVTMTVGADLPTMDDTPVSHYFCFPSHGVAVPLRPGDLLIFNPCIIHCISSRADPTQDYFCLSFYLKTLHASGNDSRKRPLTSLENDLLKVAEAREKRLNQKAKSRPEGKETARPLKRQKLNGQLLHKD
jgi:hypothetical protein